MLAVNKVLITNKAGIIEGNSESIKKSVKLISRKLSKGQKLSKFQKSAKLGKKLSKCGNLPNFDTKKNGPSFLNLEAKTAFYLLWLAFIEAPIFDHFNLKYQIQIETDALDYAINNKWFLQKLGKKPPRMSF